MPQQQLPLCLSFDLTHDSSMGFLGCDEMGQDEVGLRCNEFSTLSINATMVFC